VLIEEEESGYMADRDANSDDARTLRSLGINAQCSQLSNRTVLS